MSAREENILVQVKTILPRTFQDAMDEKDAKLNAYIQLVLNELNLFPPLTGYTIDTMPSQWDYLLVFGANVFSAMFMQMDATLRDFSYNDQGLSLSIDHVSKIDTSIKNLLSTYKSMIENAKAHEIVKIQGVGIGTPRFQSTIGSFIRIMMGSAWPSGSSVPRGMY